MNKQSHNYLKDIVLEVLQIIMNAQNESELRKDVLNYFSAQEEDIFHVFKFMILSKSKEELQTRVVKYLVSRQPLLLEFLEKLSSEKHTKECIEETDDDDMCSTISTEATVKSDMPKHLEKDVIVNQEWKGRKKSRCIRTESESMENGEERPKKIRKSKYDYIYLQGDLSHISRDPKSSKGKKKGKESHGRADEKCQIEKEEQDSEISKEESLSEANQEVKSMIETLTKPSSNQSREQVLGVLRSDPTLRKVFMKEKERLGKQKIPIVTCSKRQGQEERGLLFQQNEVESLATEHRRNAEFQETISFLFGAIAQNTNEEQYDDVQKIEFSPEGIPESFPPIMEIQPPQNSSDISHFIVTNSSDQNSAMVDGATCTQIHCPSDERSDDHDIVNEMLLGPTKTIIDNALHEHFQQLSREQFTLNNAHLLSDNEAVHL